VQAAPTKPFNTQPNLLKKEAAYARRPKLSVWSCNNKWWMLEMRDVSGLTVQPCGELRCSGAGFSKFWVFEFVSAINWLAQRLIVCPWLVLHFQQGRFWVQSQPYDAKRLRWSSRRTLVFFPYIATSWTYLQGQLFDCLPHHWHVVPRDFI
jgi:hypothetical protein